MCYVCEVPMYARVVAGLRRLVQRVVRRPGLAPRLLLLAAFAVIAAMYCTNEDMGGDPQSPRGDGRYRPVLARGDGHMLYLMARSTALDGDWIFDNDLARFGDPWNEPRTQTGRKSIVHPVGPALVWTPLIWLAQGCGAVANVLGASIPMHGYTLWHQRLVFFSSVVFACGAVLLGRRVAHRFIGGVWASSYAAVCILLGTSVTYYATYMPSYSHALDAFACAAFLGYWALTIGGRNVRRFVLLGVLLGCAMLIRVQELALGVVVAIEVGAAAVSTARTQGLRPAVRWLALGVLSLAVTLLVFIPQLLEWHLVFGSVSELPQGRRYTRLEAPMIGELLYSARNGWFAKTPLAYFACLGLLLVPKRARLVGVGLLAAVLIQIYLNSTVMDWWAAASFGQRRMCNVTIVLVVGLASLFWRLGQLAIRARRVPHAVWHALLVLIMGAFVAWNLDKVTDLKRGKPASEGLSPSCCSNVPKPLRGMARWIYQRIGNPFQFPANVMFACLHDVDVRRWDQVVGIYPFVPPWNALTDAQLVHHRGTLATGSPGAQPLLVDGFSSPTGVGRTFRWTTKPSATLLVPNLMPYGQRLTLWLAPGGSSDVTVRWNGRVVAQATLSGWTAVQIDLPTIELHTNEITIAASLGMPSADSGASVPDVPVGVAVSDLRFEFLPR